MPESHQEPPITLVEYQSSAPIHLTSRERESLRALVPGIAIVESFNGLDLYSVNPGGKVGAVQLGDKRFVLRPKVAIQRLLFLLSYSADPKHWLDLEFGFAEDDDLFEALIPGFAFQLEKALRHGLRSGYRAEEAAISTVRGRIRVTDQIRSHFGEMPPVECSYDEFTDDTLMNQILKAAILRLGAMRIRDPRSRNRLRVLRSEFSNVSAVSFEPGRVPEMRYDRLNSNFRGPVELARLILASRSIDGDAGRVAGASFLVDLPVIFEDFVVTALREALGLSPRIFPQQSRGRKLFLDSEHRLKLQPDLTWWDQDRCVFVGDVKYKRTPATAGVQHPDVYQALAYTSGTSLSTGVLIYAAGEEVEHTVEIPSAGKSIKVLALNLDQEPSKVIGQIEKIAETVREQASVHLAPLTPMAS